ncbi:S24 family peptidase [Ruegeria sp.]|uniref:S24 family peptidase n=1 Tax=Ruegeria sp. TaxID=1879320 RepID=UPI003B5A2F5A
MQSEELTELFRLEIERQGTNPFRVAKDHGLPANALRHVLKGHEPKVSRAAEICEALGLEFYIGPPRGESQTEFKSDNLGPVRTELPSEIPMALGLSEDADASAVIEAIRTWKEREDVRGISAGQLPDAGRGGFSLADVDDPDARFDLMLLKQIETQMADWLEQIRTLPVPQPTDLEAEPARIRPAATLHVVSSTDEDDDSIVHFADAVQAGAGPDEEVFSESTDFYVQLPPGSLPKSVHPERCIALRASGDSMEPGIRDGDILVIDRDDRDPAEGRAYVFRTSRGLVVKRLTGQIGNWSMYSDNANYASRKVTAEDRILGHVVWVGPERIVEVGG